MLLSVLVGTNGVKSRTRTVKYTLGLGITVVHQGVIYIKNNIVLLQYTI